MGFPMNVRLSAALALALLAPIGVTTVVVAWVSASERLGGHPFAGLQPYNSAEAAALANAGELLRFMRRGENPHAVYPVRPEVISSAILRATTIEAAMWSRQLEMIKLLDRETVIRDDERARLTCLAVDLQIDDVVEYFGTEQASRCTPGQALGAVTARTAAAGAGK
jgi:hypothetical protein